jgi:secondary thiamine-phosphate synthase enzyme
VPKEEYTNITSEVKEDINKCGIDTGLVIVYTRHTTACVRLLEPEILLKKDMSNFMEKLAPSSETYYHDDIIHRDVPPEERKNGYSHLRAMLLNNQEIIPIISGNLDLGKWQNIFYVDCDLGNAGRTFNVIIIKGETL